MEEMLGNGWKRLILELQLLGNGELVVPAVGCGLLHLLPGREWFEGLREAARRAGDLLAMRADRKKETRGQRKARGQSDRSLKETTIAGSIRTEERHSGAPINRFEGREGPSQKAGEARSLSSTFHLWKSSCEKFL